MRILAIDPGPVNSAWVLIDRLGHHCIVEQAGDHENVKMLLSLFEHWCEETVVVCEGVENYGMPAGDELFETVFWSGRFNQASCVPFIRIKRTTIKLHLCNSRKAKDSNVRQALIDRFGGKEQTRKGGLLAGISEHKWSALAVAVTYADIGDPGDFKNYG